MKKTHQIAKLTLRIEAASKALIEAAASNDAAKTAWNITAIANLRKRQAALLA